MQTTTQTTYAATPHHQHSRRCWWDHRQARWTCPVPDAAPHHAEAAGPRVDVRDMLVVHTALLRELRLTAPAVERAAALGARSRVRAVSRHVELLCTLLHHHHQGEDELLWPVLGPRLAPHHRARLELAEAQHAGLDRALQDVATARQRWTSDTDETSTRTLSAASTRLHELLAIHLRAEERDLLPLAATHLTTAEWQAVGEAGAAGVPRSSLLLVFGMFAYEGDPAVLAEMLAAAPAPVRALVPRLAPRAYRRHARRIHGTTRP